MYNHLKLMYEAMELVDYLISPRRWTNNSF